MNAISKEPEHQEIEALLPWHAAGTLSRRDANGVEQALADDRELARQYDLVREELIETIHLNETLGAPSARAMERLFAAIDAEEARAPRSWWVASRLARADRRGVWHQAKHQHQGGRTYLPHAGSEILLRNTDELVSRRAMVLLGIRRLRGRRACQKKFGHRDRRPRLQFDPSHQRLRCPRIECS